MMATLLPGLRSALHLHPMLVHFPIAFWVAAALLWALAMARSDDKLWQLGLWLHSVALVSAFLAVGAGYWATSILGHDAPGHHLVHRHRDIMLIATGLAFVITSIAWWRRSASHPWRAFLLLGAIAQAFIVIAGADRGALLVYQRGVGVELSDAPAPSHSHQQHEEHSDHEAK